MSICSSLCPLLILYIALAEAMYGYKCMGIGRYGFKVGGGGGGGGGAKVDMQVISDRNILKSRTSETQLICSNLSNSGSAAPCLVQW